MNALTYALCVSERSPSVRWASLRLRSLYPFVLHALADVPPAERPRTVIADIPAGNGLLTFPLAAAGYDVVPLDLFEEYFERERAAAEGEPVEKVFERLAGERMPLWLRRRLYGPTATATVPSGLRCRRADMEGTLPLADASVDRVVCVEGIEHVADRHRTLSEFRRVLRPGGRLLMTTPNLLSARARVAYALAGQRALKSYIDEYTSVWGVSPDGARVYHGHAFLINYFQVRYSLHHTGFAIRRLWPSNWSLSSVALLPLMWPLTWLFTRGTQRRARRKYRKMGLPGDGPYPEMLGHLLSTNLMLNATLIVEAEAVPTESPAQRAARYAGAVVAPPAA